MKSIYNNYFRKSDKSDPVLKAIESVPIFDNLLDRELSEVARLTHERTYKKDEYVFKQNAPAEGMYVILDGSVEIKDPDSGTIFASLNAGDFFGELALLDPVQKVYRLLLFIIVGFLTWGIFPFLAPIIGMLLFSFLFTTIFLQAADSLERYTKSRSLGVFIILASVLTLGVAFIGSFISNMGSQIKSFTLKLQRDDFATSIENLSNGIKDSLPETISNMIPESEKIIIIAKNSMLGVFQSVLSLLGSAGSFFFISFMVLIFTIILLIEYHDFKRSLVRFIPNKYLEVGLRMIYNIEQQISKYLRGQILAAGSVAILSIIGLFILNQLGANITLIVFIGIIAGLANLIPMVGPFIGMIPAILIALMNNVGSDTALTHQLFGTVPSPFYVLDIVLMFIIVQQIDNNFITPLVVGESVGLHPMAVMLVLLIGGTLIGPLGMLFAIPAAGVLKVVIGEIVFVTKNSHLL